MGYSKPSHDLPLAARSHYCVIEGCDWAFLCHPGVMSWEIALFDGTLPLLFTGFLERYLCSRSPCIDQTSGIGQFCCLVVFSHTSASLVIRRIETSGRSGLFVRDYWCLGWRGGQTQFLFFIYELFPWRSDSNAGCNSPVHLPGIDAHASWMAGLRFFKCRQKLWFGQLEDWGRLL